MNIHEYLKSVGACSEAREWASQYGTLREIWANCPRGDWLLWLAAKRIGEPGWPTHRQVVLAACDCAETALPFVANGEDRPAKAIATALRWAHGEATIAEVRAEAHAAADAADAADAAYAERFRALENMAHIVRRSLILTAEAYFDEAAISR